MDKRELCGVTKGVDERIEDDVLRWFGHVERSESDMIAKRVYVGDVMILVNDGGYRGGMRGA